MRTLAAMLIAPLAVVPVLIMLFGPGLIDRGRWRDLTGILLPAVVVAYPLLLLCGLPMHVALVRGRCTRRRDYALTGLLLGAVPVAAYVIVAVTFDAKFALTAMADAFARNAAWGVIGVVVFGLCGAAVALTFRAIVSGPVSRTGSR